MDDFTLFVDRVMLWLRDVAALISSNWLLSLFFVIAVFGFIVDHVKDSNDDPGKDAK